MSHDNSVNPSNLPFSIDNILRDDFGSRTLPRHYSPVGFYVGIPVLYHNYRFWPRPLVPLVAPQWSNEPVTGISVGVADSTVQQCDDSSVEKERDSSELQKDRDNSDSESTSDSDESVKLLSTGKPFICVGWADQLDYCTRSIAHCTPR